MFMMGELCRLRKKSQISLALDGGGSMKEESTMYTPDFETFTKLATEGNLIPVCREILADTETPVTALMKLADRPHLFLLESVEGGEKWGRYSFLGADPRIICRIRGEEVVIEENHRGKRHPLGGGPL